MGALYTHTTRAPGTILTATIYNADHQNHIDNGIPGMLDDYSLSAAQMRSEVDPGENGSEALATTLAGELERLRYTIRELKGTTYWYETVPGYSIKDVLPGLLFGLTLSPNSGDLTNDIDIAAGFAADSTNKLLMKSAASTGRRMDAVWAGGGAGSGLLDTGAIGNGEYHVFIMQHNTTGFVDFCISLSPTTPTTGVNISPGYTRFRRIGSVIRAAGANLLFEQTGDLFILKTPVRTSGTIINSANTNFTMTCPANSIALVRAILYNSATVDSAVIRPTYQTDGAGGAGQLALASVASPVTNVVGASEFQIKVDGSKNISARSVAGSGTCTLEVNTLGWIDRRGRDA